jgi:Rrf2 family transcriptional regulator, iron-sulfur cluster assembly transcription factor
MIYSRSSEYAIRAFVHLAEMPEGKFVMVKNIAQQADIPTHFLAKILQQLARKGFLRSSKGPTGGFTLRMKPEDISLLKIIEAMDGLNDYQRCPGGLAECNNEAPCGMHDSWTELRTYILNYLERTTIGELAKAQQLKRRAAEKPKRGKKASAARKG